jgi:hypothetical protein
MKFVDKKYAECNSTILQEQTTIVYLEIGTIVAI